MCEQGVEFFAHLYTGNPNTHCTNDLQMVQDEFLQFGDAAALNIKTKCVFMLHQLMWECCSSTTANKHYIYSLH